MGSALEGQVWFSFHLANNPVNICSHDQKLFEIYVNMLNAKNQGMQWKAMSRKQL